MDSLRWDSTLSLAPLCAVQGGGGCPRFGYPPLTAEVLGWLRGSRLQSWPCFTVSVTAASNSLPESGGDPCLDLETCAPCFHQEARAQLGSTAQARELFLPESGWHLPLEAAPQGLHYQSSLALLLTTSRSLSCISKGHHRPKAEASKTKQIKSA